MSKAMPQKYQDLLSVLKHGRYNAIKSKDLSQHLSISESDVRHIIRMLNLHYGCCIGSTTREPAGYYIIESEHELDEVRAERYHRIKEQREHIEAIVLNFGNQQ